MSTASLLVSLVLLARSPAAPAVPWASLTPDDRAALLRTERELGLHERLLRVSARFLDTPYVASPLGEGEGPDPDPRFRLDAVDCLTFVEQSLALSLGGSEPEVEAWLERIRYSGPPSYVTRNHLMEAQWLPHVLRRGLLADVTRRYGGRDVARVEKRLTAETWQSRSSQALQLPRAHQPRGTWALNVIPLAHVMERARAIPSGTILVVVREDLPLKPTRITHLGFVVQRRGRTYLRHAARNGYGRVVDEDLASFLARNGRYTKWPVTGVALYEPRRPGAPGGPLVQSAP